MWRLEYRADGLAPEERTMINRVMNLGIRVHFVPDMGFCWDSVNECVCEGNWLTGTELAAQDISRRYIIAYLADEFWEQLQTLKKRPKHIVFELSGRELRDSDIQKQKTGRLVHKNFFDEKDKEPYYHCLFID